MPKQSRTKVFISYSHKDKSILKRLQTHLEPLLRDGIDIWDDTKIKPGSNWLEEIKNAISNAKIAICLISADFIASKFITEKELPPLLKAAQTEGVLILPVIVSASRFEQTESLKWMQSVNPINQPLRNMTWSNREEIYVQIAKIIEEHFSEGNQEGLKKQSSLNYEKHSQSLNLDDYEDEISESLDNLKTFLEEEIKNNPAKELEDIFKKVIEAREKIKQSTFTIAVLALTKSGKSTFLNALLGAEFLPISNAPETASIVHILHSPSEKQGLLIRQQKKKKKKKEQIEGIIEINKYLHELNKSKRNANEPFTDFITLHAPLYGLGNKSFGKYKFRIIDTAGYNEYGVDILKSETYDVLENADVVIYLMDYTKLKTNEEGVFFNEINERRKNLIEGFLSRLFFVVNKIDEKDRNGLSKQEVASYVSVQLSTQINGLNINPEDVLLVSAQHAMLTRTFLEGNSTKAQENDLAPKLFGYGATSPTKWSREEKNEWKQKSEILLDNSGITLLEDKIINFLENNSKRLLILFILKDTINILKRTSNYLKMTQAQLKSTKKESLEHIKEIREGIRNTIEKFDLIQQKITSMPRSTISRVENNFNNFQKKSEDIADKVINRYKKNEITKTSTNKKDISAIVKEIDDQVWSELGHETVKIEKDLQEILFTEQLNLINDFNASAEPTLRKIEQVVGKALQIKLHPINLEIKMPSREDYLLNLSKDVDELIKKDKGSLLPKPKFVGWKFYIIPWFQFREEIFSTSPDAYKSKFKEKIKNMTEEWSNNVTKIINYQINPSFQKVRKAVEDYARKYENIANQNIQFQINNEIHATNRIQSISSSLNEQEIALGKLINLEEKIAK